MYFRYDNYENELLEDSAAPYCPYAVCPYFQWDFRAPMNYGPGPGGPGGQGGPGGPGGPGMGGAGTPPSGPSHGGMPTAPPPAHTPTKAQAQAQPKAVSPESLRPCTYRYVYIWLDNGASFWAWLTHVDRRTASGWRWNGRRWQYFGIDLRKIQYFVCY